MENRISKRQRNEELKRFENPEQPKKQLHKKKKRKAKKVKKSITLKKRPDQHPDNLSDHQPSDSPEEQPLSDHQPSDSPEEQPLSDNEPADSPGEQPLSDHQPGDLPKEQFSSDHQPADSPGEQPLSDEQSADLPGEQPLSDEQSADLPKEQFSSDHQSADSPGEQPLSNHQPADLPGEQPLSDLRSSNSPREQPLSSHQPANSPGEQYSSDIMFIDLSDEQSLSEVYIVDSSEDSSDELPFSNNQLGDSYDELSFSDIQSGDSSDELSFSDNQLSDLPEEELSFSDNQPGDLSDEQPLSDIQPGDLSDEQRSAIPQRENSTYAQRLRLAEELLSEHEIPETLPIAELMQREYEQERVLGYVKQIRRAYFESGFRPSHANLGLLEKVLWKITGQTASIAQPDDSDAEGDQQQRIEAQLIQDKIKLNNLLEDGYSDIVLSSWINQLSSRITSRRDAFSIVADALIKHGTPSFFDEYLVANPSVIPVAEVPAGPSNNDPSAIDMLSRDAVVTSEDRDSIRCLLVFLLKEDDDIHIFPTMATPNTNKNSSTVSKIRTHLDYLNNEPFRRDRWNSQIVAAGNVENDQQIPFDLLYEPSVNYKERCHFLEHFTLLAIAGLYWVGLERIMAGHLTCADILPIEFCDPESPQPSFNNISQKIKEGSVTTLTDITSEHRLYIRKTSSFKDKIPPEVRWRLDTWMLERLACHDQQMQTNQFAQGREVNDIVDIANNFDLITMLADFDSTDFLMLPIPTKCLTPSADTIYDMCESIYNAGQKYNDRQALVTRDDVQYKDLHMLAAVIYKRCIFELITNAYPEVADFINAYLDFFCR